MQTYPPSVPIVITLQTSQSEIVSDLKELSEKILTHRRGRKGREDTRRWPMVSRHFRIWRSKQHPSVLFIAPKEDVREGLDFLLTKFRDAHIAARVYPPKVHHDTIGFVPPVTCRTVAAWLLGRWLPVLLYEEAAKRIGRIYLGGDPTLVCLGILVKDSNRSISEILRELSAYGR